MSKTQPTVLTCAQPTGMLHLGNYLGAIRHWVSLQETHTCLFGIVDLHAITASHSPEDLRQHTLECVAQYLACGLDPQKCKIFVQSHITGHTELAWVLGCMTPLGQLQRMTQFKDKSKGGGKAIGAGLLYYPVLMAADILLYNVDRVPVGQDQKQHLELTRDLAGKFNHTYGPIFTVPEPYIPDTAARIMSLQDPEAKMSKSDPNPRGVLSLLDPPKTMRKKIMSAVTDTGCEIVAREDKPGMSNLLQLFSALTERSISELEQAFVGQGYGVFKGELADAVIAAIEPIQERYQTLMQDPAYLYSVLEEGRVAAQERASAMLDAVYERIGFARAGGNTQ